MFKFKVKNLALDGKAMNEACKINQGRNYMLDKEGINVVKITKEDIKEGISRGKEKESFTGKAG